VPALGGRVFLASQNSKRIIFNVKTVGQDRVARRYICKPKIPIWVNFGAGLVNMFMSTYLDIENLANEAHNILHVSRRKKMLAIINLPNFRRNRYNGSIKLKRIRGKSTFGN
jgi:hypothetical protein